MDKQELTDWALANGWQILAGYPSLTKPSAPREAIVRMSLKATVASVEIKKPAGKWEKIFEHRLRENPARSRDGVSAGTWTGHDAGLHDADAG